MKTLSTQRITKFLDQPSGRRWQKLSWEEKKAAWPRLPEPWVLCNCRPESSVAFYSSRDDEDQEESEEIEMPVPPQWGHESWQDYLRWTGSLADIEPTDPDWNEEEADDAFQTTWTPEREGAATQMGNWLLRGTGKGSETLDDEELRLTSEQEAESDELFPHPEN